MFSCLTLNAPLSARRLWLLPALVATAALFVATAAHAAAPIDPAAGSSASDMLLSSKDLGADWVQTSSFSQPGSASASTMIVWKGVGENSPEGLDWIWNQVVVCGSTAEARRMARLQRLPEDCRVEICPIGDDSRVWVTPEGTMYLEVAYANYWIEVILDGDPESQPLELGKTLLELSLNRGGLEL